MEFIRKAVLQGAYPPLGQRVPAFLRPGSWIVGDRDGNPFVTAESLRTALGRAAEAVLGHYLDALHALGAELSISARHAAVDEGVMALAEASGDTAESRTVAMMPARAPPDDHQLRRHPKFTCQPTTALRPLPTPHSTPRPHPVCNPPPLAARHGRVLHTLNQPSTTAH